MQHQIHPSEHGPFGEPMEAAVRACVHCGFCLAACPTYQELGQETDSPRGRIVLMKEVLEGSLPAEEAAPYIDACLGCLACEPACPSGVPYRDLISPYRSLSQTKRRLPLLDHLRRLMIEQTLPYPERFRLGARVAKLAKPFTWMLPKAFQPMFALLPERLPHRAILPAIVPAQGERRARVALLAGCAQQVLAPDINAATIEVLTRNGVEVIIPKEQGCCGALSWHVGSHRQAQRFAIQNIAVFPQDVDAILTNAAGCGSGLHEYPLILRGTKHEKAACAFSEKTKDIAVFLDQLGDLAPIPDPGRTWRIAYHDACHLANAQGVRAEPRKLLSRIPGVELLEIPEGHLCCGSAGTYNLDQPEIAASLGRKKVNHAVNAKPDMIVSANIGCLSQLTLHLRNGGHNVPVRHTIQILRDAYRQGLGSLP